MKRSSLIYAPENRDVIFLPALTPLEASVLPAKEARGYAALHHVKASFRPGAYGSSGQRPPIERNQRQKI